MPKQVEFWREVTDDHGNSYQSPIMTVDMPDGLPEDAAIDEAKREFCERAKVAIWGNLAHGFSVRDNHESP